MNQRAENYTRKRADALQEFGDFSSADREENF